MQRHAINIAKVRWVNQLTYAVYFGNIDCKFSTKLSEYRTIEQEQSMLHWSHWDNLQSTWIIENEILSGISPLLIVKFNLFHNDVSNVHDNMQKQWAEVKT